MLYHVLEVDLSKSMMNEEYMDICSVDLLCV